MFVWKKQKKSKKNKTIRIALFTLLMSLGNHYLFNYIIAWQGKNASGKMKNLKKGGEDCGKSVNVLNSLTKGKEAEDAEMAKSEKQKMKLLYIMQFLLDRTDEEHAVTTQEIIDHLAKNEINAERKSIYTDIETLSDYGMDIMKRKGRSGGYYLASRQFELAELKLLVDAVQSSKFITSKKSRELIGKLESLCSKAQAKQLHRQVVVTNRNKAVNENIYYNVDMIYNAIAENEKIRFQYFEWSVKKEMKLRREGSYYVVSPWLLTWDDENYYLIAFDDRSRMIRHYRVDKMLHIGLLEQVREGKEQFEHFDIAGYSRKTFGMFAGEEETVTLRCENALTGVMIDRFGKEVAMRKLDETHVLARVNVAVSRQFFGWVTGLGVAVQIESPQRVVDAYREYLSEIMKKYEVQ